MKILVYGINYYPELTGIGKYTGEMCEWLASRGHQVEVITGKPYYPEWKIRDEYRNTGWHSEFINGVTVRRVPLYVPRKVKGFSRIIHETSFTLSSLFFWFPRFFRNYDVVISICPPLQSNFLPWIYSLIRKRPFVIHMQDLQVDVASKLGIIRNKVLITILLRLEKFLLRKATLVSTISSAMQKRIIEKGADENKVIFFPNWVDTNFIKPREAGNLKRELGFRMEDRIILYSGSMGEKQGLEIIIQAAEKLKDVPRLYFLFSGDGPAKEKLQGLSKKSELPNISFISAQPYEKLSELLAIADIHLVIQKKGASDLVFPSKLAAILAAGGVAIVTAEEKTNLYDLVQENGIGIVVAPEDPDLLADTIRKNLTEKNQALQFSARIFAEKFLDKDKVLQVFEKNLFYLVS